MSEDAQSHGTDHHDENHHPSPSIAPLIVGLGATLALVGILSLPLLGVGAVILTIGIVVWVVT
ncbi:MAG: hypothetical protein GYB68_12435 [Chloroflexi bacterium]|nr:hypothetical protein [Chloroflexota bacterium]